MESVELSPGSSLSRSSMRRLQRFISHEVHVKATLTTAIRTLVFFSALLGIVLPAVLTLLANALFHPQATGELVRRNGVTVGSKAVGQLFIKPGYFHGRPSAAGAGYDALAS